MKPSAPTPDFPAALVRRVCLLALFCTTLQPIHGEDFASTVMNATHKFFDPDSTSTCVLVRTAPPAEKLFLVTTAHTLDRTKGQTGIVVLRSVNAAGKYERRDHGFPIREGEKALWTAHPSQDVAVLELKEPLPVPAAPLPLSHLADEAALRASGVHVCSPLFIFTYPQRFESHPAGFAVARQGIFASPPFMEKEIDATFMADFTAFSGDSGGPVFIDAGDRKPLVVGMVLAQHRHDETVKTEYEERVIHRPFNLGTVLHARYIRETLEIAGKVK